MITPHFSGVAQYVFRPCVQALVRTLDSEHGVDVSYDQVRSLVARGLEVGTWRSLMDSDFAAIKRHIHTLASPDGRQAIGDLLQQELGVTIEYFDLKRAVSAHVGAPWSKPSDEVELVYTATGAFAGVVLKAIQRAEHGSADHVLDQLGIPCGEARLGTALTANTRVPTTPIFQRWTSRTPTLAGEERAVLLLGSSIQRLPAPRGQLDELLDWWGFVPFVRFLDDVPKLSEENRSLHGSWNDSHIHVGAAGPDAVAALALVADAVGRHDLLVTHDFLVPRVGEVPTGDRSDMGTGLYLLSAAALGPRDSVGVKSGLRRRKCP